MKDSSKLVVAAVILLVIGFVKGSAPIALGQSFDGGTFLVFFAIAIIVAILGVIKYIRKK